MRYLVLSLMVVILLISGCSQKDTSEDIYDDTIGNSDSGENTTETGSKDGSEKSSKETTEESAEESAEEAAVAKYRKITPEEAKEMMTEGNMILDVRTQQEYKEGHIADAVLIPHDIILAGDLERLPDKDQTILVYCRSGNRSGQAARALVDAGYTAVYDFGGINDWPYEVEQ